MSHFDHDDDDARSRIFDDGRRLILREEETDGSPAGLVALDTAPCTGTECPCHEVELLAWPVTLVDGALVENDGSPLPALIDVESGRIRVEDVPEPGSEKDLLLSRLRRLLRGEHLELLRERWRRARRQDDPDEWKETNWDLIDLEAMVPFLEIFPSRWDLSVIHDGRRYWVVDLWCLMPDCPCTDVALDFVAADDETAEHVFVDLETGEPDDEEASEAGLRLWKALVEDPDALDELRARRETVKRVAAELPELLAPPATVVSGQKTGRNEVCPCGSGKKFKRCCGGVKDSQGT